MTENVQKFMYALMKEASRDSLIDFLEFLSKWEISEYEFQEIQDWFKYRNIKL